MSYKAFEGSRSSQIEILKVNWTHSLKRSEGGTPFLPPDFVAEQGQLVHLLDIRPTRELTGFLGHVPGSDRIDLKELTSLAKALPEETPIVLLSNIGERAGKAADFLELLGMTYVAAMEGGLLAWKRLGFSVSRDEDIIQRTFDPQRYKRASLADKPLPDKVKAHLGQARNVRWQKLANLIAHGKRSCVDGREDKGVIGTPGGDAGEFVLVLAAVEQTTGQTIDTKHIPTLLSRYFDIFGRFYMHTDTHAFRDMIKAIRQDPKLKDVVPEMDTPSEWSDYLSSPPKEIQDALLDQLIQPPHVGCGHLRLMLLHSEEYKVRKELLESFVRAFHKARWDGSPDTDFVILAGDHAEEAVVNVTVEEELHAFARLPLVSPAFEDSQMFVNHPQVGDYLRQQSGYFMLQQTDLLPLREEHQKDYFNAIDKLAQEHLTSTLSYLAKGLPLYQVCFHGEDNFTMET